MENTQGKGIGEKVVIIDFAFGFDNILKGIVQN